jgi:ATP-binding cassette subfamily C protein CydC
MLALFALAAFEAVAPLPLAFQQLEATLTAARRLFAIVDAEPAVLEPARPVAAPRDNGIRSATCASATPARSARRWTGSIWTCPRAGASPSSAPPAPARARCSTCCCASGAGRRRDPPRRRAPGRLPRRGPAPRIALVSQHTHLFDASIRENLLLAAPDAPQGQAGAGLRTAQIHDFIAALPEGYDTWVGETGVRVSGGQARRIAIARALLRDAPILLLDEPTEGLDAATERALMDAVRALMRGPHAC